MGREDIFRWRDECEQRKDEGRILCEGLQFGKYTTYQSVSNRKKTWSIFDSGNQQKDFQRDREYDKLNENHR